MGNHTRFAFGDLNAPPPNIDSNSDMRGVLTVKRPGASEDPKYIPVCHHASFLPQFHFEKLLIGKAIELYGPNLQNLPDGSILIFAAYWSPCTDCTKHIESFFGDRVKLANRELRIKFRFKKIYSKESHTLKSGAHGQYLWTNDEEAQLEYRRLIHKFAHYEIKTHADGHIRRKNKLVMEPDHPNKTSSILFMPSDLDDT
jgi:hypothetical protein